MDELLIKYLLKETDVSEETEIQKWLSDNDENQRYFNHFKLIWEQSKKLESISTVNENQAWERFKKRVEPVVPARQVLPLLTTLRYAAAFIATLGVAWLVYSQWKKNESNELIAFHSGNEVVTKTLADGSVVTLNKNSSLSFPKNFTGTSRPVTLSGEAFFDITSDKTKPFVIQSGDVTVKVVGTSFNVKNSTSKTIVTVETGLVEVTQKNHLIKLSRGERGTLLSNGEKPVKQAVSDTFYNFYRTKELVCDRTPLWKVVELLNEQSPRQIIITNKELLNLPISTTFRNQSTDSILTIISQTLGFRVEYQEDKILLK